MKVLIDGKEVKCLNDVKIIHKNQLVDVDRNGNDVMGDLHITLTHEGMVADTFNKRQNFVSKSTWKTLDDIIEETH